MIKKVCLLLAVGYGAIDRNCYSEDLTVYGTASGTVRTDLSSLSDLKSATQTSRLSSVTLCTETSGTRKLAGIQLTLASGAALHTHGKIAGLC